jgi:hypothetical protein
VTAQRIGTPPASSQDTFLLNPLRGFAGSVAPIAKKAVKCECRFAKPSALWIAKRQAQRYRDLCRFLLRLFPNQGFTFLEISRTSERNTRSLRRFQEETIANIEEGIDISGLEDELVNRAETFFLMRTPKMTFFRGFDGNVATIVAVVFPDVNPETWRVIFRGTTLRSRRLPMSRLSYFVKNELLKPWTPRDPLDRAEHEGMFTGVRRLRTWCMFPSVDDPGSPQEASFAPLDNLAEVDGPYSMRSSSRNHSGSYVCLICGKLNAS